jgi:PAS domain S-box-containing protein
MKSRPIEDYGKMSAHEIDRLVHELQVHQIELEMQNDELASTSEQLALLKDKYFDLYDLAPIGYVTLDEDGRIRDGNIAAAELLGVARAALHGRSLQDFIQPVDQDTFYLNRKRMMETGEPVVCEVRVRSEHERWIRLEGVLVAHQERGEQGGRLVLSDVTAQKGVELELRKSERRFRGTFEQAAVGIAHVGLDGRFLLVNDRCCGIVGHDRESLLNSTFQDITHPEDLDADLGLFRKVIAGELDRYTLEKRFLTRDGTSVWVNLTVSLVHTPSGSPAYFIGVFEDYDDRRQAALDKTQLEEELRQIQKMESLGLLTGGVAHDFNNVLQAIAGNLDISLMDLSADDPVRGYLQDAMQAVRNATALIRQLMAFSRRSRMQPVDLDLNVTVEKSLMMLRRALGEQVVIRWSSPAEPIHIYADGVMMEQILMNLAVNASQAMPTGGELAISAESVALDEVHRQMGIVSPTGRCVILEVADTGCGMDAATAKRIFEPFFTTKGASGGTGLGLSTAYGLVKQHGGEIWVESEPGRGTTFRIILPQCEAGVSAQETPVPPDVIGGNETILLAEDDEMLIKLISRMLAGAGYAVRAAANGAEALEIFEMRSGDFDLMILDVIMPIMGGREAYERMRALKPDLKALFISGYSRNSITEEFLVREQVRLLDKPFTQGDLLLAVRQALA